MPLTHITRLSCPFGQPVQSGFLPEMSSRRTTPKAYTSILLFTLPCMKYSGAKYLSRHLYVSKAIATHGKTVKQLLIRQLTRKFLQHHCMSSEMSHQQPRLRDQSPITASSHTHIEKSLSSLNFDTAH